MAVTNTNNTGRIYDEAALVEAARGGNASCFETLVRRYERRILVKDAEEKLVSHANCGFPIDLRIPYALFTYPNTRELNWHCRVCGRFIACSRAQLFESPVTRLEIGAGGDVQCLAPDLD